MFRRLTDTSSRDRSSAAFDLLRASSLPEARVSNRHFRLEVPTALLHADPV